MVDLLGFQLEKAYDTVMMQQLQYRKKGVTYGSVEVSSVLTNTGCSLHKLLHRYGYIVFNRQH
jgi:hypothetical protein